MAFMKFASAVVVHPNVTKTQWRGIRVASTPPRVAAADLDGNLIKRAEEFFDGPFNPKNFLLTHATIIASVDTFEPPGTKTGSQLVDGFRVNRRFADYRVTADTQKYINNNRDCWQRDVLMASFPTFIGGHNFVEHVQVEELSKGRIIDAVARDIGDSIYIDILIATDRRHKDLVKAIESGKMGTLSMGCFLPGTQVTMADGRRIAIEDVQPGDMVLTHKGRACEVLNKQIRHGEWGIRRIQAVGVPNTIEATDNHPFFVFRRPLVCACGCGEALLAYKGGRQNASRELKRRFKPGHDKRILNPNGSYSLQEYRERKARLDDLKEMKGEWVRADELRIGDFLTFPRVQTQDAAGESIGKARLLGYFLAEGSFLKYKGEPVEVQLNFSSTERETFVAEVVELLKQEFPDANDPWIQDRDERNTCVVHCTGRDMVRWFFQHGGEYSHRKKLSEEVLAWSVELHKHLIGAWLNGDGHHHRTNGNVLGTTGSYDLACQMHMLMNRCGWFTRLEAKRGAQVATNVRRVRVAGAECLQSDVALFVPESEARHPHFNLVVGKTQGVDLAPYTAKAPTDVAFKTQGPRVRDDLVMFPITSIEEATYEGPVHNMEVDEDNSYVVEGVASHNCTVDGTQCTKCGHWAADETEMCPCVKYSKGNSFHDEQGRQMIVAELCGHKSIGPTGGVHFVEASWVETPAFTGAVKRNIIVPTAEISRRAAEVLASPPPEWAADQTMKAASGQGRLIQTPFAPAKQSHQLGALGAENAFLAGWGDEEDDEGDSAPAEDANPVEDAEKELEQHLLDRAMKRVKDRLKKQDMGDALEDESSTAPNDNVVKEGAHRNVVSARRLYASGLNAIIRSASSEAHLVDSVAAYNQEVGVKLPVPLYRAALLVGPSDRYLSTPAFKAACDRALGHPAHPREARVILKLARLLSRWNRGEHKGNRQGDHDA